MNEEERELFKEEMRRDAYDSQAEIAQEGMLRRDYDAFVDYHQELFDDAMTAIEELKNRHTEYGHEFDIRELEG